MPTYEFRCPAGHDFERFYSKISDSVSETPCPECGAVAVRRISGGAGLLFKGSGFYITDYGKDGKKDQKPAAPKSGAGSDAAKTGDASGKGDVARKADGGTAGSTSTGTGSTSTGSGGTSGSGGSGGSGSSPSGGASGGSGPKPAGGA